VIFAPANRRNRHSVSQEGGMHAPITHQIIATVALVALPLGLVYAQAPAPATVCVVALAEPPCKLP
jgi:hypothetical protein